MSIALETMLVATPGTCGGRLRINGTRITLLQVASLYRSGLSAEDIEQTYEHLSIGQVYAALAYYHTNQDEVNHELVEEDALYDRLKQESTGENG